MQTIKQWLESDDELPDSYNDRVMVPAFTNDNRFEQTNKEICSKKVPEDHDKLTTETEIFVEQEINKLPILKELHGSKVSKQVLRKQDIICLKCIEKYVEDDFLLWFVNYLLSKDMLSDYKFLKSCLVYEFYNGLEQKIYSNSCYNINQILRPRYRIKVD